MPAWLQKTIIEKVGRRYEIFESIEVLVVPRSAFLGSDWNVFQVILVLTQAQN